MPLRSTHESRVTVSPRDASPNIRPAECPASDARVDRAQGRSRHAEFLDDLRKRTIVVLDHKAAVILVTFMTMWALYMDDLQARPRACMLLALCPLPSAREREP